LPQKKGVHFVAKLVVYIRAEKCYTLREISNCR
jgi:hypothetical protein